MPIPRVRAVHLAARTQRSSIISQRQTHLSYIQKLEAELLKKLQSSEDHTAIVKWISGKILESYRNGITAGQKGTQVIHKEQGRRPELPSQAQ